jgi:dTMP kinase
MRGKFITFEGGEGTGKSTQAAMLARQLESLGVPVQLTREPGGSPGAEIIRHVLLSGAAKPLGAIGDLAPDLTVILDVPVSLGVERAKERRGSSEPDRFEAENAEFHEQLRKGFLDIAAKEPDRCVVIDASPAREEVANAVWTTVVSRLHPEEVRQAAEVLPAKA